jgi:3'(2'), 5'-bisphosphate nucleotidase
MASARLDSFDRDTRFAVSLVRDSMRVARALEDRTSASLKTDRSPVTAADFAIQAIVAERLGHAYPNDPLIAEEAAASLRGDPSLSRRIVEVVDQIVPGATIDQVATWIGNGDSRPGSRFWTLDPIDGTKGFIHGRQYVIALALIVDGRVQLGVIGCPRLSLARTDEASAIAETAAHGGVAIAVRGRGAWWSPMSEDTCHRLAVSTCRDVTTARFARSFETRHGDHERWVRIVRALGNIRPPLLMDSQAKHVTLAAGACDLLMRLPPDTDFHDAAWDQAAGSLLIEEAGGRVTDLTGARLDFAAGRRLIQNTGMLASNGLLHDAALRAIRGA